MNFVVTLSAATDQRVTVLWATSGDTATEARDYASTSAQLTFAPGVTSQNVVVRVQGDDIDEGQEETFFVTLSNPSEGVTLARAKATGTITDDDTRGLVLSKMALNLTEAPGTGRTATYTVALASQPTAEVMVDLRASRLSVVTLSPDTLTFAPAKWASSQTVTVTSVDDEIDNDPDPFTTIGHHATGGDYGSVTGSVAVNVTDDDQSGVIVSEKTLALTEGGEPATYTLKLGSQPTKKVTVKLGSEPSGFVSIVVRGQRRSPIDPIAATFDQDDWNQPKTVIVRPRHDDDMDDNSGKIVHTVEGYGDVTSADPVTVSVTDTSEPGLLFEPESVTVAEGGTATYKVRLATIPPGTVTVTPKSADVGVATVSGALSFNAANWNRGQEVTVTGVEDDDGAQGMTSVSHSVAGYHDDFTSAGAVPVTVTDDDAAIILSKNWIFVWEGVPAHRTTQHQTYEVKLAAKPGGTVTVTNLSRDEARVMASPATLTFDTENWAVGQKVTAIAMFDEDGYNHQVMIDHSATGYNASPVALQTTVRDYHGRSLHLQPRALELVEGQTGEYSVKLRTDPEREVTVTPTVDDESVATVSGPLTFDSDNWSVGQPVTVTTKRNLDSVGTETITVNHSVLNYPHYVTTHPGSFYLYGDEQPRVDTVAVKVNDYVPHFELSGTPVTVTEASGSGRTATYTVALAGQPTAEVTVALASDDPAAATVKPAQLTFTTANGQVAQTVTVTGVDNAVDNGEQRKTRISHSASGGDYEGVAKSAYVTVVDDDERGLALARSAVTVTEAAGDGHTATYTVALASQPTAEVTVALASGDEAAATVSPAKLTFTTANWQAGQTVTVTAVDDAVDNGLQRTTGITHSASGGDYGSVSGSVAVTVTDDDERGLTRSRRTVTVTEAAGDGRTATYTVALASQPTAEVTVALASGDEAAATVSPAELIFTTTDWQAAQTVTVTGVDDDVDSGSQRTTAITHSASGGDYGSVSGSVAVRVTDDDKRGLELSRVALTVAEAGGTDTYTVALESQPSAEVTIALASGDEKAATVSPAELTFTADNWDRPQTVTVTGVDDDVDQEGAIAHRLTRISHSASGGDYGSVTGSLRVYVADDEGLPTFSVQDASQREGDSGEAELTFTITLAPAHENATQVHFEIASDTATEGVDFTNLNQGLNFGRGDTQRTVSVKVIGDEIDETDETLTLTLTQGNEWSGGFLIRGEIGLGRKVATGTILDDDTRGLVLSQDTVTVSEAAGDGRTATYSVALASQPTAAVTVALASGDDNAATVSPATLSFTTENWKTGQTVTVTGVDDNLDNEPERTTTISHTASGGDYGTVTGAVAVTVADDEAAASFAVAPASVAEGDTGTADLTFAVTLTTPADRDATVNWSTVKGPSDDATPDVDYTAASGTLSFAAGETEKSLTVKVAGDLIDEDDETLTVTLSGASGVRAIGSASATGTILDDDTRSLVLSREAVTVSEAEGAGRTATYSVALASRPTAEVTLALASGDDSAATVSPAELTFTAENWQDGQTVTVTGVDDNLHNAPARTTAISHTASGADYGSARGSVAVTITDDESTPTISIEDARRIEGDSGESDLSFTVTLSPPADRFIGVELTTSDGTAMAGQDYTASRVRSGFAAGSTETMIAVKVIGDELDEGDETFTVTLSRPTGGSALGRASATGTITDDDTRGLALSRETVTVTEAAGTGRTATYNVALASRPTAEVTVALASADGNAATVSPATLSFTTANWKTGQPVTVTGVDDSLDNEPERTTTISHSASGGDYGSVTGAVAVTVADDEAASSFAVSPASVTEGNTGTSDLTFAITLMPAADRAATVAWSTTKGPGDDATPGVDYTAASGTLSFAAGETEKSATVKVAGDQIDEDDETLTVTLSAASGVSAISTASATGTITDDDTRGLALSRETVTVTEAAGAGRTATYSVALATRPTANVMVALASADDSEATVSPATLTFTTENWQAGQTVTVTGVDDNLDNSPERTTAISHTAGGGDYGSVRGSVAVTITDDESTPTLSVEDARQIEGDSGQTYLKFTVTLSPPADRFISVRLRTSDGTATAGEDYTRKAVHFGFSAGLTEVLVPVKVLGDEIDEDNETFTATLSEPSNGGVLGRARATGTITDDDDGPTAVTLAVSPPSAAESAEATAITVTASLVGSRRTADTAVTVSRTGGTATSGTDYKAISDFTVTIAAGESSGTATLSFDPEEDTLAEGEETVILTGRGPPDLSLTAGTATLTITDNDAAPTAVTLAVSPTSAAESAEETAITVTASLVGSQRTEATAVTVSRTGGTASSGTDYEAISNFTVTIAAGASSGTATLSFDPAEDLLDEDNETVVLTGTGPTALGLTPGTATLTITDNDDAPTAVTLAVDPSSALESANATEIKVTATLVGSQRTAATAVTVSRTGGTATSGTDYKAISEFTVTIPAGESSGTATLSFDPEEDTLAEGDETVVLTGTGPTALGLTSSTATLTITDNDDAPTAVTLAVNPASAGEGAEATDITVTATLVGSQRTADTAVTVSRTGGTATSGTDYEAISTFTVTIAAGESSGTATLSFDPTEDELAEGDETVVLTGSAPSSLGLTAGTATLTITDNDAAPTAVTLAVNPPSAAESAEETAITVTASLVGSKRGAATAVTVSRTGGTATSGTDYAAISEFTVTIAAGESSGTATLSFDPTEDELSEGDETVVLTGSAPSSLNLTSGTATLTITDNDAAPTAVTLAVNPDSAAESADETEITVTASLVGSRRTAATAVTVSRTGGTATSGTDYAAISEFTVTIAAGESSGTATLSFDPTEDTVDEPDETVVLTGSAPSSLNLTSGTATLTITDNDDAPELSIGAPSVAEGDSGTADLDFVVTLTGSTSREVTVAYADRGTGTASSGTDYAAVTAGTLTFAAGDTSKTVTVAVTGDTVDEANETVVLRLSSASNASLSGGAATLDGTGTITDDDAAPTAVTLAVNPDSAAENASATEITVTASLVGSRRTADTAVTVSRTGGTATSGTDYEAISNFTVTIAAGESSGTATLSFDPTEDTVDEPDETVVLTGAAASSLNLSAGTATLTITDNDDAPELSIGAPSVAEGDSGTADLDFVVTLTGGTSQEVTVAYADRGTGTASSGEDYAAVTAGTLTFAAGDTSKTVTVAVTGDTVDEPNETVVLRLSSASNASLSGGAATLDGTGTITDDDAAPTAVTLAVDPGSALESANATEITVTASLVGSRRTADTAVTVSRTGGTATSGTDYEAISNFTVTIAAGESSGTATLSFDPTEDTVDEPDETVVLTGAAASSLNLTAGTATLTITDNDDAPELSIGAPSVAEGDSGTADLDFVVTLTGSTSREVTVAYADRGTGTASSGTDYAAVTAGTLTFAAGDTSKTVTVAVTGDTVDEANETVVLRLSSASNASLSGGAATLDGTGTITDDDAAPTAVTLAVDPASALESANATEITVTATLVGSRRTAATAVTVSRTGGTATSGTDYAAISNFTVTIAAGESSGTATLSFDPTEDTVDEPDETVVLTGSAASSLSLTAGTATLTITDNDDAPELSIGAPSVAEGDSGTADLDFVVTLTGSTSREVTVAYADRETGTASSGTDYAAVTAGTLTFAAGDTSKTVTVAVTGDTVDEPNETVVLRLSSASNASLSGGAATLDGTGTITDDDAAPTGIGLAVNPASAAESADETEITVTASLVGSRRTAATAVTVSRTGGTATSGTDYAAISNFTVTIAAGESSGTATLSFDPTEDTVDEPDETVVLTGSAASSLNLTAGTATLTITDNDDAPELSISSPSVAEGDSGTADLDFVVTLTGSTSREVTVAYADRETGTATSGTDYAAVTAGTLTFAAGDTSKTVTVSVTGDTVDEANETVVLRLSSASNASLSGGAATLDGTGTITDDDAAPTGIGLTVSPDSAAESASATEITVTATLVGSRRTAATAVTVSRTGGTATSGTDYEAISNFTVTIAAGESSGTATLSFDPTEDTVDEPDETVVLTGSAPSSLSLTAGTATLTITDNDDAPELSIGAPSVAEGDSGTADLDFVVTLTGSTSREVTVAYADRGTGTASSGEDYAAVTAGTLTFAAGDTSKTVTVAVTGDTVDEANETVVLRLSSASNASLSGGAATLDGTGTITDDDAAPTAVTLAVNPASAAESADETEITVTASLVGSRRTADTAVTVSRTGGTATSGTDYEAISEFTVTIAAGESSGTATLSFDPTEDTVDEPDETVVLTGAAPSSLNLTAGTATLTITDNDDAPELSIGAPSVAEGDSGTADLDFVVTLTGSTSREVTVAYADRGTGTASSGTDYAAVTAGTLTFAAGDTSKTVTVAVTGDTVDEANETVVLRLSSASNASLSGGAATLDGTGTITDDDAAPTGIGLAVNPASAAESADETEITVTASLVGSRRTADTAVTVSRTGGTATSGTDYKAISEFTVTIAAGESSGTATLSFDPTEDTVDEPDETVVLTGSAPSSLSLTAGTATLTITDNDDAPELSIGAPSVAEGDSGTADLDFVVTLTGSTSQEVTVAYADRETGTASSGTDYAAVTAGTLTFAAGDTSKTVTVAVTGDTVDEPNETVVLRLSSASNASLSGGAATLDGTGTITDDDAAPTGIGLAVDPGSALESANATEITVTASLVGSRRTADTAVTVSRTGGTATSGTDYEAISNFTVTIAAGESSGTATLSFDPTEDTVDEPDETVVLTGSAPSSLSLTAGTATLTITDNDDAPELSIGAPSVAEGDSGTADLDFVVTLTGSTSREVTVAYADRGTGTASSGEDYAAVTAGTLTFAAGDTSKTVTVAVTGDTVDEANETVVLRLSSASNASLSGGAATLDGTGTITDDDAAPTGIGLTVSPDSAAESASATEITVTATLVGSRRTAATAVTVSRTGGTATSGTDYEAISNFTVTIAAGESSGTATLSFDPTEDTVDEPDETVVLTGSAPSSLSLTAGTATLTITDNDDAPELSIGAPSVAEGDSGTADLDFVVTLTGSTSREVTVAYADRGTGTASSGEDYAAVTAGTLTFAAGDTSKTVTVAVTGDTVDEANETVVLRLSSASNASLSGGAATLDGTGTITDDDAAPTAVTLAVNPASAAESADETEITVTASLVGSRRTADTAVTVSRTGGTATSGTDYEAISEFTVTIAAGESSGTATLSFDPTEDTVDEPDETVVLTGAAPSSLNLTAGTATLTITDNDDAPELSIGAPSVAEGDSGTADLDFVVTLTGSTSREVTVAYADRGTGTASSGTDYAAVTAGTLTFAAGDTSKTVTVAVTGDTVDEANETVVLRLSSASNASLSGGAATLDGTGTITDDDAAPTGIGLAVDPGSALESANATEITVTASLVGSRRTADTAVTVSRTGGTATSGTDYEAISNFTVTIAAGESSGTATLSFDPTEDTVDEPDETVVLTGSAASSLSLTAGTATLTITDNDDAPELSIGAPSVAEGDSGTADLDFVVTLTGSTSREVTVAYADRETGTATSGTDYAAVTAGTLTFAAGDTSKTVTVAVTGDTVDEANETVVLQLSSASNASLSGGAATLDGTGTITDDDAAPTGIGLAVSPDSAAESASATSITVTASLVGSRRTADTAVTVSRTGGTATSGTDYEAISNFTVTIAAGESSGTATLSFDPTEDTVDEPDETVVLTGSAPSSLNLTSGTATLTITDNDDAPELSIGAPSVAEGDSGTADLDFVVTLTGSTSQEVTVAYADRGTGTASSGEDYAAVTAGTLTFAAGDTSKTVTVAVTGDTVDEANETVVLRLSSASNASLSGGAATLDGTGTITDDDAAPTGIGLAVSPDSAAESASATEITVTATLVGSRRTADTAVTVSRTGGTATSGTDYKAISEFTVTIAAGESSGTATLSFDPTEDTVDEPDETVVLTGSAASSLSLTAGTATLTITDNDDAPELSIGAPSVAEGDSGTADLDFVVTLTGSTSREVTVAYADRETGTATSGTDYAAVTAGTLTFAAGDTSKTVTVAVTGDTVDEANETVVLRLSSASNASLSGGAATLDGTGTITDDDAAPTAVTLAVNPASAAESADETAITVTASLVGSRRTAATAVTVSRTGGTATSGTDYAAISNFTVTIAAGESSGTATLSFDPTEDTVDEPDETVVLTGAAASSLNLTSGTATLTITDNDDAPELSISSPSVAEGDSGTADLDFVVTLTGSTSREVTVAYADRETGTATSGTDYAAVTAGTLTFAAGDTSKTVTVSVTGDTVDEANETVVLRLSSASNASLSGGAATLDGTGTITDDDAAPTAVTLAVDPGSALESANATEITVTASLVGSRRTADTAVTVSRTGGTATSGTDYEAISNFTVTIAAGESSGTATLSFDPTEDTVDEPDETVVLTGAAASSLNLTSGTATLTITDNDDAPELSISSPSVAEGDSGTADLDFVVTLTGSTSREVTVAYADRGTGTASSGTDYAAVTAGTLTFAAGDTSKTVTVAVTGDTVDEANETVVLRLSSASNASLSGGAATLDGTGTITDDDAAPTAVTLAVNPASAAESADETEITVTASLVGSRRTAATAVTVSRTGGTATSGTDYKAISEFTVTIAAGESSGTATLSFDPTEDTVDEPDETVVLTGAAPSSLSLTAGTATLTITDNDAAPELSIGAPSVAEGDSGTADLDFVVTLTGSTSREVTVAYADRGTGTASSGEDYAAVTAGTLTFAAGDTSKTVTVAVTGDTVDEPNETVVLRLSSASNASLSGGAATLDGTGTITDDDAAPTGIGLTVSPDSAAESASATEITVTATLVGSRRTAATAVTVSRTGGTATSGTDYEAISNFTVTIAAGESSGTATLSFDPTEDTVDEPDETVVLTGAAASSLNLTAGTATLTITDNDDAPELSISSPSVAEGDSGTADLDFVVTLTGSTSREVTVAYADRGTGTASSGTDYAAVTAGTLTFAAGDTSKTVTVAVTGDTVDEANETVVLRLSSASNASLSGGAATLDGTGTITDDDAAPTAVTLAVNPASAAESADETEITVTASLVGSRRTAATAVTVSRTGGTATSGTDYKAISEFTVTIAAGESSGTATLSFDPTEDTVDEPDETVVLTGAAPSSLSLTAGTATLTITDNDAAPELSIGAPSVAEGDSGTADLDFVVTLTGSTSREVTVAYADRGTGTASSGEDYAAVTAGTLTFAAGDTSKTVTVAVTGDTVDEPNETVVLRLSSASNASLSGGAATLDGTGTITDDDAAPTGIGLTVSPDSAAESASATEITVTATLVGSRRTAATAVTVSRTGGTATSGTDYEAISNFTVTIAAGESSGTATLSFDPTEDTVDEPDETVVLTGAAASSLNLTSGTATLTITDNDDAPELSIGAPSVAEGDSGTADLDFVVTLTGSTSQEVTVAYADRGTGTASSGTDYAAVTAGTLTFAAGDTSKTVTVSVTGDTVDEANETVVLRLSSASNASLSGGAATLDGTGTITDDDAAPTAVTLAVDPGSALESANATEITVTASLVGSRRTADTAVTVSRTGGTATSGTDYEAISNFTVTIAAGESSGTATLSFDPTEDTVDEPDETVVLTGSAASSLNLTSGTATLTITDNDDAPELSISSPSVAEGDSGTADLDFVVTLTGSTSREVTVAYADRETGTATSGTDYAAVTAGTLTFAAGDTSKTVTVSVTGDTVDEANETVVLRLSSASNASLSGGAATLDGTGTITDDDAAPTAVTLAVDPGSAAESASATEITVTATLVGSRRTAATAVTVSRTGGTATSGTDYKAISEFTVTIAAGESSGTATLSFDPTEDTVDEPDETVVLTGAAASSLNLTSGTATLTITDNDDAPELSIGAPSVAEGDSGTADLDFVVTLTGSTSQEVTVAYADRGTGTASSGEDYAAVTAGTLTFAAGDTSKTVTVSVTGDTVDEANETVVLRLSSASNASLSGGAATLDGTGTITDDDAAPTAVTLAVDPGSALQRAPMPPRSR